MFAKDALRKTPSMLLTQTHICTSRKSYNRLGEVVCRSTAVIGLKFLKQLYHANSYKHTDSVLILAIYSRGRKKCTSDFLFCVPKPKLYVATIPTSCTLSCSSCKFSSYSSVLFDTSFNYRHRTSQIQICCSERLSMQPMDF